MNSAEVLIKFKGDTSDADKATKEVSSSLGGLTKSFTIANLAAKGISKTLEIFNEGLDGAISRTDTMNNFPRVMDNLGISAEDSAEVISDLSEKLKGLPTTLDSAAAAVQRFTSKNGDVAESEKLFLAVNNAILAGGASPQIQASALEQLSQAYAKGKPDMIEWRTLMTAMPAQLKQVATAMGYVDSSQLGEAVRSSEAEFSRMMDTMMLMNTEGVNGFKSFDEQARSATGGVRTSITNMRTAFVRGIGGIITSVDEALEPMGGLSGVMTTIGKAGEEAFKGIGEVLKDVMPMLIEIGQQIMPVLKEVFDAIAPTLKDLAKALLPALSKLIKKLLPPVTKLIQKILPLAVKLIEAITPLLDPLVDMIAAIIDIQMALIEPLLDVLNVILPPLIDIISNLLQVILPALTTMLQFVAGVINMVVSGVKNIIKGLIDFIVGIPETIIGIINGIINFITSIPGTIGNIISNITSALINFVTQTIPSFISNIISFFAGLPGKIWNIITTIPGKIKDALVGGINKVKEGAEKIFNKIWDTLKGLPEKLLKLGEDMVKGIWNGIKNMGDWIGKKISGFADGVVKGFKKAFGIHSPSVLLEKQIGVNLGLGVVKGIDDTTSDINKTIGDIAGGVSANIGASLNASTLGSMNSNVSPKVIVYNNVTMDPLGQTVSNIKTFSGGAKNDYNYGVGV